MTAYVASYLVIVTAQSPFDMPHHLDSRGVGRSMGNVGELESASMTQDRLIVCLHRELSRQRNDELEGTEVST